jgi:hypothetical protein
LHTNVYKRTFEEAGFRIRDARDSIGLAALLRNK